jgi:hypothetical protein
LQSGRTALSKIFRYEADMSDSMHTLFRVHQDITVKIVIVNWNDIINMYLPAVCMVERHSNMGFTTIIILSRNSFSRTSAPYEYF